VILLDTQVLVWASVDTKRLSKDATHAIERARRNEDGLAISAITLWEIALLITKGRLRARGTIEASVKLFSEGILVKPITAEIAALATQFPDSFPSDLASRIIGATARAEGLTLITRDENIRKSPLLKTVW
jgi:PIN domain nuclease of toxin-antitoxin system